MITNYRKIKAERNRLKQVPNKLFVGEIVEVESRIKSRYEVFKQRYASGKSVV